MVRTTQSVTNVDVVSAGHGNGHEDRRSASSAPRRTIVRRRSLPGGRAVAGGFLMAIAAVLVFWGSTRANHPPRQLYVIATRDLAPGERLTSADLTVVPLDIPSTAVRRQIFGSPAELLGAGATVLAPVSAGALIESSDVVGRGGAPSTREMSLDIDRSRAVGGTLKAGEFVDVLSTFGSGPASFTTVVVPHIQVLTATPDATGSGGTTELIVFAVPDGTSAEALANAAIAAQVTLVRSDEQPVGAPVTTVAPYRPSTPGSTGT
jgi:Flp pilus assembly protein CpaB